MSTIIIKAHRQLNIVLKKELTGHLLLLTEIMIIVPTNL